MSRLFTDSLLGVPAVRVRVPSRVFAKAGRYECSGEGHTAHPVSPAGRAVLLCLRRAGPRARVRHRACPENMDRKEERTLDSTTNPLIGKKERDKGEKEKRGEKKGREEAEEEKEQRK